MTDSDPVLDELKAAGDAVKRLEAKLVDARQRREVAVVAAYKARYSWATLEHTGRIRSTSLQRLAHKHNLHDRRPNAVRP